MRSSKIRRKSTFIDMTPFVDVAFLILTFFILVTKFKPDEIVTIQTPSSVSSEVIKNDKDAIVVMFDKTGKVYFQVAENIRKVAIESILSSTDSALKKEFIKTGIIATPISQIANYYATPEKERNSIATGIPVDSLNNELSLLIKSMHANNKGKEKFYIKGDNAAKYPAFKNIIKSLKENNIYEFNLITTTEQIPSGSALASSIKNKK
ncbi:MAG: ExbD/TolR family protein [Solirubrobacteraceae bacterium]